MAAGLCFTAPLALECVCVQREVLAQRVAQRALVGAALQHRGALLRVLRHVLRLRQPRVTRSQPSHTQRRSAQASQ